MALKISFAIVLLIHVFTPTFIPIATSKSFSLKLTPRHMIDTALFPKNLTSLQQHEIFVQLSRDRALYFKSIASANSSQENIKSYMLRIFTSLYIVQIIIGTNLYSPYLLFDSGSDHTWLQCDDCINCFPLSGGNFNYHQSKTYKVVSCNHPLCVPKMCSGDICLYRIQYIGGASTSGILSAENFTFLHNDAYTSFPNLVFGCGFYNQNIRFGSRERPNNVIAGIFGMGAGPISLLNQLNSVTNFRFSYCLVSWTTPEGPYSYIHYGDDAQISGDIKTIQLLPQALPRYYLPCTGISLNADLLPIDPSLWVFKPDKTGGFAVDTGSGPTFLVKSAYTVVKDWVYRYFEGHGWHPIEGQPVPYDVCYRKEAGQGYPMPSMTYHFEGGADLVVDPSAVFQNFDENDMMCLAVMPMDDDEGPSLLGAFQQFCEFGVPSIILQSFSVKLMPRHLIDTALFPKNLTLLQQHEIFVQLSRERALYFKSLAAPNTTQPQTLRSPVVRITPSLYIAQMIIGTTPYSPYLVLDSGSDDTWIQCEGCSHCFPLVGGNFRYLQSTSFRFLSCHHHLCVPKICSGDLCMYQMQYMGGSITGGVVSVDTFTFPYNQGYTSISNVIFGCGFDNRNIVFGVGPLGPSNTVAGVFGIGVGPRSLLSQLAHITHLRFSYCLVSWTTSEGPNSLIHYGDGAQISGGNIKTIALVPEAIPRYHLYCTGISFNGHLLPIDPALWVTRPDGTGGFAIDSGCGATFLVKSAYAVVKRWVKRYFEGYGRQPLVGRRPYDICFRKETGWGFPSPSMTFHFQGGVDLEIDPTAVFQVFDDWNMVCLAVMGQDDDQGPSLLGAFQQVNYRFLFDVNPGVFKLYFAPQQNCFNT
ncbi:Aspartic peptidase [Senna tora]|uniref:Aspartic peptidase n=1 Tax=Senna tora TaxID=362788 RepID=A0A834TB53_9FABA|nr:Aspartic peptidase [Senna tora]